MDLTLAYPPLLLVLAAAGAAALTWWTYGRSRPRVHGPLRGLLVGLRFAALFVVLLLLFEPIYRRVIGREEAPLLAVLVDVSQSLSADPDAGGPAPADRLRRALATLPRDARVRYYTFDANVRPTPADSLVGLRFSGPRTDIARALARVEHDFEGRNLRGVLLLSDGRYTAGRNPLYLAERFRVPVYTAVVGDSVSRRDVRVSRVVTNEVAYLGSTLPVRVGVRATGFREQRTTVTVSDGGRVLASQSFMLPADGVEAVVDLDVVMPMPGLRRLTAALSRMGGEATYRNNAETVAVRVLDTRRRVLLLGAAPGPDLAALREHLEADRRLEVVPFTQRAPGSFYEGPLPPALSSFDLAVLAGWPGRAADAATVARVAEAAQNGLPLLFVLTRQTDLAALARSFGAVLPAVPEVVRPGFAEAGFVVAPAGSTHPVLTVPNAPREALGSLPPVEVSETRWRVAPDARVLATVRRGGVPLDDPLLAVRTRGGLRSAAVLGAGTWRWRTLPQDLGAVAGFYGGLVDNLLRWTTAQEDRRRVRVRPTRALFGEGEAVTFVGQVYDESLNPIEDAEVRLVITAPNGAQTPLALQPAGNGRYTLNAGVRPSGSYAFTAVAERGGQRLGDDQGAFAVGAVAVEFREPGADVALMRQLALRSGGRVVPLDEVGQLRDELAEEGRFRPRVVETERETPLLQLPALLALAVALLSMEWVLRKRAGMI